MAHTRSLTSPHHQKSTRQSPAAPISDLSQRGVGDLDRRERPPNNPPITDCFLETPSLLPLPAAAAGVAAAASSAPAVVVFRDAFRPKEGRRMGDLLRPRGEAFPRLVPEPDSGGGGGGGF